MGIFDDTIIGKVGAGIKKTKADIDTYIENQKKKRDLITGLTINDLKKICKEYGIGEPSGGKDRGNYIDYIVLHLELKNIKDFCNKSKVEEPTKKEPVREEQKTQMQLEKRKEPSILQHSSEISELHEILHRIKDQFKPEPCTGEKELQGQLKIWLDVMYHDRISREVPTPAGKIDIGIDKNKYGIEVKIANDKGTLRNLIGQVLAYKQHFNEVGIVLLDVNKLPHSVIHEYVAHYNSQGVETVLIQGQLRKGKSRQHH